MLTLKETKLKVSSYRIYLHVLSKICMVTKIVQKKKKKMDKIWWRYLLTSCLVLTTAGCQPACQPAIHPASGVYWKKSRMCARSCGGDVFRWTQREHVQTMLQMSDMGTIKHASSTSTIKTICIHKYYAAWIRWLWCKCTVNHGTAQIMVTEMYSWAMKRCRVIVSVHSHMDHAIEQLSSHWTLLTTTAIGLHW